MEQNVYFQITNNKKIIIIRPITVEYQLNDQIEIKLTQSHFTSIDLFLDEKRNNSITSKTSITL